MLQERLRKTFDGIKEDISLDTPQARLAFARLARSADILQRKLSSERIDLQGVAKAELQLLALDVSAGKLRDRFNGPGGLTSALGSAQGALSGLVSPMGGLVLSAVALSPVIATVGFGLAGFGAAAVGAAEPIMKAAQATGGLKANMSKLDPEQQKLARSVLGLGEQYDAFSKALAPEVLLVFGRAIGIAGHLMKDLEPVAAATGRALGGLLGAIDKEFAGGTWQQFFDFMARTAGPDIRLLGTTFVSLMEVLPPLVESFQPVAMALLNITTDAFKVIGVLTKFKILLPLLGAAIGLALGGPVGLAIGALAGLAFETSHTGHAVSDTGIRLHAAGQVVTAVTPQFARFGASVGSVGTAAPAAAGGVKKVGDAAAGTKKPVFDLTAAVKMLTDAMAKNVAQVLTLQGDEIQWRESLRAASKQLDSNSAGLRGNSKDALANKAAVLQASQNAMTFADDQLTLGGNLHAASRRVEEQIAWLQKHGDKSRWARDQIHAFRVEDEKIKAKIAQRIDVTGSGTWRAHALGQGPGPFAAGGLVPGWGGGDRYPALLEGGELVVPKGRVPEIAGWARAAGIPGMASGGVAGTYAGSVPGLGKWLVREDRATLQALDKAVARGTLAAMRAGMGPGGGGTIPGGLGRAGLRYLEGLWMGAGGPGAGTAHVAAAIALAESGGNPRAFNPSGASGLWQILGAVDPRDQPFLFNPVVNAHEAVLKYRGAQDRFTPWVTWTTGAYRAFMSRGGLVPQTMDAGGWIPPGPTLMMNRTGRYERLTPDPPGRDRGIEAKLDRVIALLEKAPRETGREAGRETSSAMAEQLSGAARRSAHGAMYSALG